MVAEKVRDYRGLDTMRLKGSEASVVTGCGELPTLTPCTRWAAPHRRDSIGENFKPEGHWPPREMFIEGSVEIHEDNGIAGQMAGLRYHSSNGQVPGRE